MKEPFASQSIVCPAAELGNRQSHLKAARSNARRLFLWLHCRRDDPEMVDQSPRWILTRVDGSGLEL
jgi:hypothetical protein